MHSNNVLDPEQRTTTRPARTLREGWPVLAALILAILVVTVDNTVMNVALPSIAKDLDASNSQLQWIVNAYSLLFGGLLLTGGSLADRLGRRRVLLGGLGAFGGASLLVLVVSSAPALIGLRALTGACAAFLMPSTLSLMYRAFEGPVRGTVIGVAGAVGALGFVLGPLIGGALLEVFAWQSVFLVNVPLAWGALIVARAVLPADGERSTRGADVPGTVLSIGAMLGLVAALVDGPDRGWTSLAVLGPAFGALAAATAFVAWERRAAYPMLDVRLLARRRIVGPGAVQAALMMALTGTLFLITQQLQVVWGYSPVDAGLRSAPIAVGVIGGGSALALVARRFGSAWAAAAGLLVCAAAVVDVALTIRHGGYWPVAGGLLVFGAGVRMCITPTALAVLGGLPEEAAGIGAALADTFQEVGGAFGVALLGSVFNAVYRADLPDGAPAAARASLQGALGSGDGGLADAARGAFGSGAQVALLACAAILAGAAVIALRTVPGDLDLSDEAEQEAALAAAAAAA
ncbi:Antiseptic resistance protein [Baekduia alba]|uniref:MFS transporter n=1 Tax=Baekduia alba TaxID=2997333 RepID=UPI002340495C|nr:MFS transporter [Baekduia alba]WCB93559.1 Antiseptic resistance protein [Baekduia alba]